MTIGRYAEDIAGAQEQIAEDGELSKYITKQAIPISGQEWRSSGSTSLETDVNAVWLNFKTSLIDGQRIKKADRRVLIAAADLPVNFQPNPEKDTLVRIDGSRWQVKDVDTLAPNEELIMHTLQCRRSRPRP